MEEFIKNNGTQTLKLGRKEILIVTSKNASSAVVFVVDINKIFGIRVKRISTQNVIDIKESYAEQGYKIKEYVLEKDEQAFIEIKRTSFEDILCVQEKTINGCSTICVDPVKQLLKVKEITFDDFVSDKNIEQTLKQFSEGSKKSVTNKEADKGDGEMGIEM